MSDSLLIYGATYLDAVKLVRRIAARGGRAWTVSGFIDDTPEFAGRTLLGVDVLGGLDALEALARRVGPLSVFPNARSSPAACRTVMAKIRGAGAIPVSLVDPDVDLDMVEIGIGCSLSQGCVLGGNVRLGEGVTLRYSCTVSHDSAIGDYCCFGPGVVVGSRTVIGEDCFFGTGAVVLPNVRIGGGSVIGAGAVVHRDLPAGTKLVAAGWRVCPVSAGDDR